MLKAFQKFIQEHSLFKSNQKILLAVSGGVDSVVLTKLFYESNFEFAIAHCNFSLRNSESDKDQAFAENIAKQYSVPFFSIKFDTLQEAKHRKLSIQMVARELRYEWFHNLLKRENYQFVATAHHANDLLETMLINLTRGTGIAGFHGILPSNQHLIRPLLFATKEEILDYATKENLEWREDSSNSQIKYTRNLIRHKVTPILKGINPNIESTTLQTAQKVGFIEEAFKFSLKRERQRFEKKSNGCTLLEIAVLKSLPFAYLFSVLEEFGYGFVEAEKVFELINKTDSTGKIFKSESFKLLIDRESLIITSNKEKEQEVVNIDLLQSEYKFGNNTIRTQILENRDYTLSRSKAIAELDFEKLNFPLILRPWKDGDNFTPLGMKGKKKISDFLIDKKISLFDKKDVYVVVSDKTIVWVVGMMISEKFKITETTTKTFKMELVF